MNIEVKYCPCNYMASNLQIRRTLYGREAQHHHLFQLENWKLPTRIKSHVLFNYLIYVWAAK
jgi:hypothetical protein